MKLEYRPTSFLRSISLALIVLGSCQTVFPQQPAVPQPAATPKPSPSPATAKDLIAQGIQQYRKEKFDLAAKQFLAALKLEPNNDEALGYASLTAYQLGNLAQARELFQRRADLANQKSSIKTFSTYMVALTCWRQAHELIAKRGELRDNETVYNLPEKESLAANEHITAGLATVTKVLAMKSDYAEAVNVRNLLHAEAATIAASEGSAKEHRAAAMNALRQAIKLHKTGANDFGAPTILIGEFGATDEEQNLIKDLMLEKVEGGRPLTRATAVLPVVKIAAAKPKSQGGEPPPTGVGPGGSAVSVGPGQGALRPSKTEMMQLKGGLAKVEVLINTLGKVVFARMLDGPAATTGPALTAAKKWTFSPPKFEGHPVQVLGVITFNVKSTGKDAKAKPKAIN
jgi:tetratricopeptide (TPR) repeat protein